MARRREEDMTEIAAATIEAAKVDREGAWKITLAVPMSDGPKVAALALHTETVFKLKFTPVGDRRG